MLNLVHLAHRLVGPTPLQLVSSWLNGASNHMIPVWNPYLPKGASALKGGCGGGHGSGMAGEGMLDLHAPCMGARRWENTG